MYVRMYVFGTPMYVCMCARKHVCIYACIRVYACMCIRVNVCICKRVCMYVYVYVYVYVHVHVHVHVYVYICVYACMLARMYTTSSSLCSNRSHVPASPRHHNTWLCFIYETTLPVDMLTIATLMHAFMCMHVNTYLSLCARICTRTLCMYTQVRVLVSTKNRTYLCVCL
jgi:hypothetical protein